MTKRKRACSSRSRVDVGSISARSRDLVHAAKYVLAPREPCEALLARLRVDARPELLVERRVDVPADADGCLRCGLLTIPLVMSAGASVPLAEESLVVLEVEAVDHQLHLLVVEQPPREVRVAVLMLPLARAVPQEPKQVARVILREHLGHGQLPLEEDFLQEAVHLPREMARLRRAGPRAERCSRDGVWHKCLRQLLTRRRRAPRRRRRGRSC